MGDLKLPKGWETLLHITAEIPVTLNGVYGGSFLTFLVKAMTKSQQRLLSPSQGLIIWYIFFVISEWNVPNFETDISLSSFSKESPLSTQNEVVIGYHFLWLLCILMMIFHLEFQKSEQQWRTCFLISHAASLQLSWQQVDKQGSLAVKVPRHKCSFLYSMRWPSFLYNQRQHDVI